MIFLVPVAFAVLLFFLWKYARPAMRGCRWRMDHGRDAQGQVFYRCAACGAETLVAPGTAPDFCALQAGPGNTPDESNNPR